MAGLFFTTLLLFPILGICQFKVSFDDSDSTNGYYIAIPPASNTIRGVLVLFCNFRKPESMLPETKLHNVAAGNDLLTGGLGHDLLTGGAGNDVFDFNSVDESPVGAGLRDIITDFQSGQDKIDLSSIDTNPTKRGDQGFRFIGTQSFDGKTSELRYQTFDQPGTANDITVISGDINGDKVADFEIELTGIVKLISGDFLL